MSIIIVGGHDKMVTLYREMCEKRGHRAKVFTQLPPQFEKALGQPDGIILFTEKVSHKMVKVVVQKARRNSIPILRCHTSSATSLESLLYQIEGNQAGFKA